MVRVSSYLSQAHAVDAGRPECVEWPPVTCVLSGAIVGDDELVVA